MTLKDQLDALLKHLQQNYTMAVEAQSLAGDAYYHVQSICVGLKEDMATLAGIIQTIEAERPAQTPG